ncbi:MAG: TetR/AcrR family transcriptional regulator, partial [Phocaeicola sp.]
MGRGNKKEAVAALHREQIISAAERIFSEKGFAQTTIADISNASEYSRRTIYAYYESKEDILHHIIAKGLQILKCDIEDALQSSNDFLAQYFAICNAMKKYQTECPHSLENATDAKTSKIDFENLSPMVKQILLLGVETNALLAEFIQTGKEQGVVKQDVIPMQTVYILWSSITALLTLIQTKGVFIAKSFSISEDAYLEYGLKQIINSILEVR